ncbi:MULTISPECIES: SAM-dependent methyltransferase [unclassified Parabacteroides]|uniref:SAM-dependent methyltransferase n=1 Tax=unclassified Parabacteroides TaxID=2649774 RepID=UPI002474F32A|nr:MULTISPECIES: SAM-dependent methyltransferase [unclassified Parabacteroides]
MCNKYSFRRIDILLYRRLRYRKGHGVHSPFVYNLITKVIEERSPYYCFDDIELIRKQIPDKKVATRQAISPKHGALLFRLANHFNAESILQVGSTAGLSMLYLSSHAPNRLCVSLETNPALVPIAKWVYEKADRTDIDQRTGDLSEMLRRALVEMKNPDIIYFNVCHEQSDPVALFNSCVRYLHTGSVIVFEGIRMNQRMRDSWKEISSHSIVSVSIDLYSMGILFFNERLHKREYIVYF